MHRLDGMRVGGSFSLSFLLLPLVGYACDASNASNGVTPADGGGGEGNDAPAAPEGGADSGPGVTVSFAHSGISCIGSPVVASSDQSALETGNAAFAFDLYGSLVGTAPGNVAFSPYSVSTSMAMAYAGALGNTASQIAATLHYTLTQAQLHPAFGWLGQQIAGRTVTPSVAGGSKLDLRQANAMWGEATEAFKQPYVDTLAGDYCSGLRLVDFEGNPAGCEAAINAWVSDQTGAQIPQLLPSGAITVATRLALVNALFMAADWAHPFDTSSTRTGATFTRLDGSTTQVAMMEQFDSFPYASGAGYQAIELAYIGGQVAMDVVLPAAGTEATFEAGLTASAFQSIASGLTTKFVDLSLPRFRIVPAASVDLVSALRALGIVDAFDMTRADFSAIAVDPLGPLFIKHVFHRATVDVDETGTEATAATAVIFAVDGGAGEAAAPVPMVVDRSFFFAIRDLPTGTILFAGRVADPNG